MNRVGEPATYLRQASMAGQIRPIRDEEGRLLGVKHTGSKQLFLNTASGFLRLDPDDSPALGAAAAQEPQYHFLRYNQQRDNFDFAPDILEVEPIPFANNASGVDAFFEPPSWFERTFKISGKQALMFAIKTAGSIAAMEFVGELFTFLVAKRHSLPRLRLQSQQMCASLAASGDNFGDANLFAADPERDPEARGLQPHLVLKDKNDRVVHRFIYAPVPALAQPNFTQAAKRTAHTAATALVQGLAR